MEIGPLRQTGHLPVEFRAVVKREAAAHLLARMSLLLAVLQIMDHTAATGSMQTGQKHRVQHLFKANGAFQIGGLLVWCGGC